MAIVVFGDIHTSANERGTASYDRLMELADHIRTMPPGLLGHICFEIGDGWQVIGIWESEAAEIAAHTAPATLHLWRKAGISPSTHVRWEVHNHYAQEVTADRDVSGAIVALSKEGGRTGTRQKLIEDYDHMLAVAQEMGIGDWPGGLLAHVCLLRPDGAAWRMQVVGVWASEAIEKAAHNGEDVIRLFRALGRPESARPAPACYPLHNLRLNAAPGNPK